MTALTDKTSRPAGATRPGSTGLRGALTGAILAGLLAFCVHDVCRGVVPLLGNDYVLPAGAFGGLVLGRGRFRRALWAAAGAILLLLFVVGFTPVVRPLVHGLVVRDPVEPAPVVVVLAADVFEDGSVTASGQARIMHAYELLRQGFAPRLLISHGPGNAIPWSRAVRQQMQELRFDYPVDETQAVANTHDEALAVQRLTRARGWDRAILVTHPWHMRRAAAVFRKAGVRVICSPCDEIEYDFGSLLGFGSRLAAFRDWAHEAIGYRVYSLRGWI